jgi:hypothetical protein
MAVTSKDVTIGVSDRTITIKVLFPGKPGYRPLDSIVTVKLLPNGPTDVLTGKGSSINGGAQFQDTVQTQGQYAVNVVCSSTTFSETVPVPGTMEVSFHHDVE